MAIQDKTIQVGELSSVVSVADSGDHRHFKATAVCGESSYSSTLTIGADDSPVTLTLEELQSTLDDHRQKVAEVSASLENLRLLRAQLT